MDKKGIIAKIYAFLSADGAAPQTDAAPTEAAAKGYQTKDGATVNIDKLEVGGVVTMPSTDGAAMPVPAGDLWLADGTKLTIGDGGAIAAIEPPATTDPAAQTQMSAETFAALESRVAALEGAKTAAQMAEHVATEAKLSAAVAQLQKENGELKGILETIAEAMMKADDAPTEKPQAPPPPAEKVDKKTRMLQRFAPDAAKN